MCDTQETKRNEAWTNGLERLLTRFDRLEADMGLSAERWSRRDVDFSRALDGGIGSGSVHSWSVFAPVSGRHPVPGGIEFM